jgi:hypothetical protein
MALLIAPIAACYSLTPQDRAAEQLDEAAQDRAYCYLERVSWDDDAGDISAARAFLRAAHTGSAGILRRNTVDAGPPDAGIWCAP